MKNIKRFSSILTISLFILILGCTKEDTGKLPTLTTAAISNITNNSAQSGGNITDDGGLEITARGICYNTSTSPSISNLKTTDGTGKGAFTSNLSGLAPNNTYYVRAYATNSIGTIYGNEISFKTNGNSPTITTVAISNITPTTITCGGNITDDGGSSITSRGVCWHTSNNPTISNNKTNDGAGIGMFISQVTDLTPNTTYYIRAYVTNSSGTSYGNILNFTTTIPTPTISTNPIKALSSNSVISGGYITSDGGVSIIARGVCWNTSPNPTISDHKTTDGSGTLDYLSRVQGLTANTTYYIRSYATNSYGTTYGNELSFKTLSPISDVDGNVYNIVQIGTQTWMAENLKTTKYNDGTEIALITSSSNWLTTTTGAYCWYNNDVNYKNPYGALYNWKSVNTNKLCPSGWHVSSNGEWYTMLDYLEGTQIQTYKLKEEGSAHWPANNNGTNESGFTALPGGWRHQVGFFDIGTYAAFWTSTSIDVNNAMGRYINGNVVGQSDGASNKIYGYSVRCVKD